MIETSLNSSDNEIKDTQGEGFYAKYDMKEVIGTGLSSIVRLCVCKETSEEFAVKIIEKNLEKESTVRNEIAILSRLQNHPNIISLVDYYENDTGFFLVFELATGGEFFDYLTKVVTVPESNAKVFMYQILTSLAFMHSKNIVHRDIKPENILLENNKIIISDFGFSVLINENEILKDLCGTPDYMAPEILRCSMDGENSGYGKEIDIWSCGVILYMMFVGYSPFWHRKQTVMLWKIMDGDYKIDTAEWNEVAEGPKDLIIKMLTLDPKKRITAESALNHPWFTGFNLSASIRDLKSPVGSKRISFKALALTIVVLKKMYVTSLKKLQPIPLHTILKNPYNCKAIRNVLDVCSFHIYDHWIKRSNNQIQNRTALFQVNPKTEKCEDSCSNNLFQYRIISSRNLFDSQNNLNKI